jgi:hypothetical protein
VTSVLAFPGLSPTRWKGGDWARGLMIESGSQYPTPPEMLLIPSSLFLHFIVTAPSRPPSDGIPAAVAAEGSETPQLVELP